MMGADIHGDEREAAYARREDIVHAAMIRAGLCAARGLTPSQACSVGCQTCGVIDASPERCEQCTGTHSAVGDTASPVAHIGPSEDTEGGAV